MGTSDDSVKQQFEALIHEYFPRDPGQLLAEYYATEGQTQQGDER